MSSPVIATMSAQPGRQTEFLRSAADICIYGGAAGGGKTVGLILEPLRHATRVANFTAVFFRRSTPQITNPGGLWDESQKFYSQLGGIPHIGKREWRWPRGGKIKFAHLQFDNTVYDWQGAQIALICFDELTHFTAHQFFYMVSRNRSTCGVKPYIRATCNPDADSWVAEVLSWWIDQETGFPIPARAGLLRGVGTKTVMPRRNASARSGRCGESGLTLMAVALFHGSMSRSRAAATSAPAKFGIRPCGGNGKRATPSALSLSQTHCRAALLSAKSRAMTESGAARPGDSQERNLLHEKPRRDPRLADGAATWPPQGTKSS